MDNRTTTLTLGAETREIELTHVSDYANGFSLWKSNVSAYARIGHGKKLWKFTLRFNLDPKTGKFSVIRPTINNRNNTIIVSFDTMEKTDTRRSQHKGQYTKTSKFTVGQDVYYTDTVNETREACKIVSSLPFNYYLVRAIMSNQSFEVYQNDLVAATTSRIIKRGRGYYEVQFYFNNTMIGSGYATNKANAEEIADLFINLDSQYTQIGKEIVKL